MTTDAERFTGRPVKTTDELASSRPREMVVADVDVQATLREQWDALGRKVLRIEPYPVKLVDLAKDFLALSCAVAWFETGGNITHAAERIGVSRRTLRDHIKTWKRQNPHLVPSPPVKPPTSKSSKSSKPRKSRAKAQTKKVEAQASEDGA